LSSAVFVTADEKKELEDLVSDGIRVYTQQVPTDSKKDI